MKSGERQQTTDTINVTICKNNIKHTKSEPVEWKKRGKTKYFFNGATGRQLSLIESLEVKNK